MNIIERRLNPGGKSFANRQRFLRRARAQVRKAVGYGARTAPVVVHTECRGKVSGCCATSKSVRLR